MRPGTFWSGLTTLVILAVPVLAGLGLLAFDAVYQSGNYVALMGYGLLALGSLLGYRAIKAKAGPAGLEVEADKGDAPKGFYLFVDPASKRGAAHKTWESIKESRKEEPDAAV